MEYRIYAALLFDGGLSGGVKFNPIETFTRTSPNRLKTGLQTDEGNFA